MILISPSFQDGEDIPRKFTCDGGSVNPEIQIQNVPENAESLALVMHDPDAPRAGGFTHWLVWNIKPKTALIKEESVPPGAVEGANDARETRYAGPCPPRGHGAHHYHLKRYALDIVLDLSNTAGWHALEAAMRGHVIAEAELVGTYERK